MLIATLVIPNRYEHGRRETAHARWAHRSEFEDRERTCRDCSAHPAAKVTIVLTDEEGKKTDDVSKAKRYGLMIQEGNVLLHEEFGDVDWIVDEEV